MKINGIKCPVCKTVLFSRARHDFRQCDCINETFVDGGFDYLRYGYKDLPPTSIEIELDVTKEELYHDWNHYEDKYGKIAEGEL